MAETLIRDAEQRVALGLAAPTLAKDYRSRLRRHCLPFFGKAHVASIDSMKLREFRGWLAGKGLSASTILTVMSFVSMVLKLAEQDGHLQRLPTIPRGGSRDRPRPWLSKPDYIRLLEFLAEAERTKPPILVRGAPIDRELREIVAFTVNAFLRPGDIFALRYQHVDVVDPLAGPSYLRLNLPPSKRHSQPVITMPVAARLYAGIRSRRAKQNAVAPTDYVFLPDKPNRSYAHRIVMNQFTWALGELGLKYDAAGDARTLYSLRHTAIMFRLLGAQGLDLLTLARNCRTSVEMIDRFYASALTAEMNRHRLHGTRSTEDHRPET